MQDILTKDASLSAITDCSIDECFFSGCVRVVSDGLSRRIWDDCRGMTANSQDFCSPSVSALPCYIFYYLTGVGSKRFVAATKKKLGFKVKGRKVVGEGESYELRESPGPYKGIFGYENGVLRPQNEYPGVDTVWIST